MIHEQHKPPTLTVHHYRQRYQYIAITFATIFYQSIETPAAVQTHDALPITYAMMRSQKSATSLFRLPEHSHMQDQHRFDLRTP
jgi:hypothetical protein